MEDVVENAGFLPAEHMLLYHFNIGYPFVDEGAEFDRAGRRPAAAAVRHRRCGGPRAGRRFIAPQQNWVQQTFEHSMVADADGTVEVAIFNPRLFGGTGLRSPTTTARCRAISSGG